MSLHCPNCGTKFSGYHKDRDQLALELGRCVDCGGDKTDEEIALGRWRCATCANALRRRARQSQARGD